MRGGGVAWDGRRGCRCFETRQWLSWVFVVVLILKMLRFFWHFLWAPRRQDLSSHI